MKRSGDASLAGWNGSSSVVPPRILDAVREAAQYMGEEDDWVAIKIQIMNSVRPELRRLFSRRDQTTRDQIVSDFDRAVMIEYERASGVAPVVRTLRDRQDRRSCLAPDDE